MFDSDQIFVVCVWNLLLNAVKGSSVKSIGISFKG